MPSLVPGPYVDSTCSEGQVVCRRSNGSIGSVWRGAGVRTTCSSWLVVRGLASPLASYLLTTACVGTPAGNAGSGNPICKRTTCSVDALNVNSLASCGC